MIFQRTYRADTGHTDLRIAVCLDCYTSPGARADR